MKKTKTSDTLSKGRTNNKKVHQYSDAQNQAFTRSILLRLGDADLAVRKKQPFKDIAQHLTGQLQGREYEPIKTRLNKMLKPEKASKDEKPSKKPSLINIPSFKAILVQALQGKRAFEAEVESQYKGWDDQLSHDSTSGSLGKRTPLSIDTFTPMLYAHKQSDRSEVFESLFSRNLEAESALGDSLSDYELSIEGRQYVSPTMDLLEPAGADYYASFTDRHIQIPEDPEYRDLIEALEDDQSIASFQLDYQPDESSCLSRFGIGQPDIDLDLDFF